ncbi:PP2C family protein-serine/threonine phosphatase [Pirellulaceae bacterium SH467]
MTKINALSFGRTDKGRVRTENQDHFFIADLSRSMRVQTNSLDMDRYSRLHGGALGHLFLVADGMGGHRGGREASQLAIQYFISSILNSMRWIVRIEPGAEDRFLDDLQRLLSNAHKTLQTYSAQEQELKGMGTTLTMSYVSWPRMIVVHAGDTRCYVLRKGELKLITRDHTVANQLIRSGQLSPEAEDRSPWANVLVNALGAGASDVTADIYKVDLEIGDRLMMCSDGLNKHIKEDEIREILMQQTSAEDAANMLVYRAIEEGGADNVTVIVSDFVGESEENRMPVWLSSRTAERSLFEAPVPEEEQDTNADEPLPKESSTQTNGAASNKFTSDDTPTLDY